MPHYFQKSLFHFIYGEIKFLVHHCGWLVTKFCSHFTFEQEAFKKEFVLNNQKERQNANTDVEKDFYKPMNNANFGVECRNNMNNCVFEPIIDEVNEVSSLKKYYNLFNKKISTFGNSELFEKEIEQKFEQKIANMKNDDPFKKSRITAINNEKARQVDALEVFKKN